MCVIVCVGVCVDEKRERERFLGQNVQCLHVYTCMCEQLPVNMLIVGVASIELILVETDDPRQDVEVGCGSAGAT